jgi:diguanylate cyclase (GGDEF)-like protein
MNGNTQVGLVLVATNVTEVKSTLNNISLAIAGMMLAVICLSGLVAFKFATNFEKTAVTDGLMGVYNHKFFKQRLEQEVAKSARYGQQTTLVMLDIDFFKRVNDTYGHATGDLVLKQLARWVSDSSRTTDVVARYGGEEIGIILTHTGLAGAQEFAERLRLKVSQQVVKDPEEDAEFRVTVSIGVAQWEKGVNMLDLIKRADAALYHSKHTGRNRVTIYQDDILPGPDQPQTKTGS